jgi:hypothetical protein
LTVEAWHRAQGKVIQGVAARLSGAFLADENPAAAVGVLTRASRSGPDPDFVEELAGHALATHDTALALAFLAQAAADPVASQEFAQERGGALARMGGMSEAAWFEAVRDARAALATHTVQSAEYLPLKATVTVQAGDGSLRPLREVVSHGPTLVVSAFTAPHNVTARLQLVRDVGVRAAEMNLGFAALLLATDDLTLPDVVVAAEEMPVFLDRSNVAADLLGVWSIVAYLVFDADGVFRGSYDNADEALRLLLFLPPNALVA